MATSEDNKLAIDRLRTGQPGDLIREWMVTDGDE